MKPPYRKTRPLKNHKESSRKSMRNLRDRRKGTCGMCGEPRKLPNASCGGPIHPRGRVGSKDWWYERRNMVVPVIPTEQVESILGKGESKKFWKWMNGQTMSVHGVYPSDLLHYIEEKLRGVQRPHVWD